LCIIGIFALLSFFFLTKYFFSFLHSHFSLQIKTLCKKDGATTAKLHLIADLQNLEDVLPQINTPGGGAAGAGAGSYAAMQAQQKKRRLPTPNNPGALDHLSVPSIAHTYYGYGNNTYAGGGGGAGGYAYPYGVPPSPYYNNSQTPATHSQRVPTFQSQRPMSSSQAAAATYPNNYSGGGGSGHFAYNANGSGVIDNSYNIFSPTARNVNSAAFGASQSQYGYDHQSAYDYDAGGQRSVMGGWGGGGGGVYGGNGSISGGGAGYIPQQQNVIFDRNLMNSENAKKLGLSFSLNIQEVDLIDLKPAHQFVKNSPFVSAACGKWTASCEVF
jgi:hypothetical protein